MRQDTIIVVTIATTITVSKLYCSFATQARHICAGFFLR
jgi:hypothetical protein